MAVTEELSIDHLINTIDEEAVALEMFRRLSDKFGWAGTVFSRDDIPLIIHEEYVPGDSILVDDTITDEEFARVRATHTWDEGIQEAMMERAVEMIPVVHRYRDETFQVMRVW
jgi:hypothetical protein